jgi:hypothetical protein
MNYHNVITRVRVLVSLAQRSLHHDLTQEHRPFRQYTDRYGPGCGSARIEAVDERKELSRRLEALANFRNALIDFVNLSEFSEDDWIGRPPIKPRPGRDSEWRQAQGLVDQLAPRAAKSFLLANVVLSWKQAGSMNRYPINPATEWRTVLASDPRAGLDNLEACMNQAKGALEEQFETAPNFSLPGIRWSQISPFFKWVLTIATPVLTAGIIYWLGWR